MVSNYQTNQEENNVNRPGLNGSMFKNKLLFELQYF